MCKNEAAGQASATYKDNQRRAAQADQASRQAQATAYIDQQKKQAYDAYTQNYQQQYDSAWDTALNSAVSGAGNYANNRLAELGLAEDPYDIMGLFSKELEGWKGGQTKQAPTLPGMNDLEWATEGQKAFAPGTASHEDYQVSTIYAPEKFSVASPMNVPNFGETLTPDYSSWFDSAYNTRTGEQQSERAQALNSAFGDLSGNSLFPDTMDDSIISSILDPQYASARAPLDRARARGQIGAPIYNALLSGIDNERQQLNSQFQGYGGDILGGFRSNLDNEMNSARQRAATSNLSEAFDPVAEAENVRSSAMGWTSGLESGLKEKAGEGSLFKPVQALPYLTGGAQGGGTGGKQGGPLLGQFEKQERQMRSQGAF